MGEFIWDRKSQKVLYQSPEESARGGEEGSTTAHSENQDDGGRAGQVVALVPARSGSKRVPHKNKLLIPYTMQFIADNKDLFDRAILATDYILTELPSLPPDLGVEWVLRPQDNCRDDTPMEDVVEWAEKRCGLACGLDIIVLLQPTSPFRSRADIEDSLRRHRDWGQGIISAYGEGAPNGNFYIFLSGTPLDSIDSEYLPQNSLMSLQVDEPEEMDAVMAIIESRRHCGWWD